MTFPCRTWRRVDDLSDVNGSGALERLNHLLERHRSVETERHSHRECDRNPERNQYAADAGVKA